jgi:hypothetical protein
MLGIGAHATGRAGACQQASLRAAIIPC